MPYFVDVTRGQGDASLPQYTPSFGESLGTAFGSTWDENPTSLLFDAAKLRKANDKPRLDRAAAEAKVKESGFKIPIPEDGYTQEALDILIERRKDQAAVHSIQNRTPWSWVGSPIRGAASLLAGVVDPLNVASAFIPVVREHRVASMLAKAGEGFAARAVARAQIGAVEGVVGAAALEPLVYGLHSQLQDDYGMVDSLVNLGFGGILGGGLHVGAGAVRDIWRPKGLAVAPDRVPDALPASDAPPLPNSARDLIRGASPEVREVALRSAIADMAQGRAPDVDAVLRVDRKPTETPEFRNWFGESTVVDDAGAPLVVYHGTVDKFSTFDAASTSDGGFHFGSQRTANQRLLNLYGELGSDLNIALPKDIQPNVMPTYLSIKRPKLVEDADNVVGGPNWATVIERAKAQGYDGLKYHNMGEGGGESWVAFRPEQIKNATGNGGRFDPNSASLTDPLPGVRAAAERQRIAVSAVADPEASVAAEERLKAAPKDNGVESANAELQTALDRLGVIADEPAKVEDPPTQSIAAAKEALTAQKASGLSLDLWLDSSPLEPEVHNLVVGLSEAATPEEQARILADYARSWAANPTKAADDIAADVVEAARSGRVLTPARAEVQAANGEALAADARLAQAQARLEAMGIDAEQAARMTEGLKVFDEGITDAKNIGAAIKAFAACGTMT